MKGERESEKDVMILEPAVYRLLEVIYWLLLVMVRRMEDLHVQSVSGIDGQVDVWFSPRPVRGARVRGDRSRRIGVAGARRP